MSPAEAVRVTRAWPTLVPLAVTTCQRSAVTGASAAADTHSNVLTISTVIRACTNDVPPIHCAGLYADHTMNGDQDINNVLAPVADWFGKVIFYSVPVAGADLPLIVVWLIVGGIVCTLAFRFVNLRGFRHSLRVIRGDYSDRDHPGEATPFQALSTAVSGTVGLGSIGGVAIAITLGGPGAAFWMMIAGFLGMSTKFAEVTLAVKYRKVRPDGTVTGGAMYYVQEALGRIGMPALGKFLAAFFCVAAVGGSLTIFQVQQSYAQLRLVTGFDQAWLYGVIVAVWVGVVLFGGVKRIVQWTDKLSPFMCLLYIAACLVVLGANYMHLPAALATIAHDAF